MAELGHLGIRVGIAVIFAVSVGTKVRGRGPFGEFRASLRALGYVGPPWLTPLSVAIVTAEAAVIALVLVPATAAAGLLLAGVLLATFAAGIAIAKGRGRLVPCRCFGARRRPLGWSDAARDAGLALVCGVGLALGLAGVTGAPATTRSVVVGVAGAVVGVLVTAADDLIGLFTREPA